jgi:hypothetical protein
LRRRLSTTNAEIKAEIETMNDRADSKPGSLKTQAADTTAASAASDLIAIKALPSFSGEYNAAAIRLDIAEVPSHEVNEAS